ncbi:NAD(P)/FAD-dependent oxidoreductase [Streptomyces sp. CA-251387]|uniref:NAD(P)/FAD-dependent oxidoreductase n=1 Tax=Streptomyces sp. CA-251387 TaxID=3240064 RepID=UPI003D8AD320
MEDHVTPRRVVILGGGFAGLFAARALRRSPVAVTVVDRRAHPLFEPLLYQCAARILSEGQVAQPLRAVLPRHHRVSCLLAEATDVDTGARPVHARRADGEALTLPYDDLIVAVGMRQSYFGHGEFAAHAPGMKTLNDALDIRRRVYQAFEMAEMEFEARTVLWRAGIEAPPIAAAPARATGATQGRAGRIAVEPDLTIPGHPEIRVTGRRHEPPQRGRGGALLVRPRRLRLTTRARVHHVRCRRGCRPRPRTQGVLASFLKTARAMPPPALATCPNSARPLTRGRRPTRRTCSAQRSTWRTLRHNSCRLAS